MKTFVLCGAAMVGADLVPDLPRLPSDPTEELTTRTLPLPNDPLEELTTKDVDNEVDTTSSLDCSTCLSYQLKGQDIDCTEPCGDTLKTTTLTKGGGAVIVGAGDFCGNTCDSDDENAVNYECEEGFECVAPDVLSYLCEDNMYTCQEIGSNEPVIVGAGDFCGNTCDGDDENAMNYECDEGFECIAPDTLYDSCEDNMYTCQEIGGDESGPVVVGAGDFCGNSCDSDDENSINYECEEGLECMAPNMFYDSCEDNMYTCQEVGSSDYEPVIVGAGDFCGNACDGDDDNAMNYECEEGFECVEPEMLYDSCEDNMYTCQEVGSSDSEPVMVGVGDFCGNTCDSDDENEMNYECEEGFECVAPDMLYDSCEDNMYTCQEIGGSDSEPVMVGAGDYCGNACDSDDESAMNYECEEGFECVAPDTLSYVCEDNVYTCQEIGSDSALAQEGEVCYSFCEDGSDDFVSRDCDAGLVCTPSQLTGFDTCGANAYTCVADGSLGGDSEECQEECPDGRDCVCTWWSCGCE